MKNSLLLLTTVLSFNIVLGSSTNIGPNPTDPENPSSNQTVSFLERNPDATTISSEKNNLPQISAHIHEYHSVFGLNPRPKAVGQTGCCSLLSKTFSDSSRFLFNELGAQLLTRLLAIALDDLADGKLDGVANGKKVLYAQEIAQLLGVEVREEELKRTAPIDNSWIVRLSTLSVELTTTIIQSAGQKDRLLESVKGFAKHKMKQALKNLAIALIIQTDRIIALELGNGKVDGLDKNGAAIDWQKEIRNSVDSALSLVLDGVK